MRNTILWLLFSIISFYPKGNELSAQEVKHELGITSVRIRWIEPSGFEGVFAPFKLHPTLRYTLSYKAAALRINAGLDYRNQDLSFLPSSHYFIRGIKGPIYTFSIGQQVKLGKKRFTTHFFSDLNFLFENYRFVYDAGRTFQPDCPMIVAVNLGVGFKYRFKNDYALGLEFYSPHPLRDTEDCFEYSFLISSGIIFSKQF